MCFEIERSLTLDGVFPFFFFFPLSLSQAYARSGEPTLPCFSYRRPMDASEAGAERCFLRRPTLDFCERLRSPDREKGEAQCRSTGFCNGVQPAFRSKMILASIGTTFLVGFDCVIYFVSRCVLDPV